MHFFRAADLNIAIDANDGGLISHYSDFLSDREEPSDLSVTFIQQKVVEPSPGKVFIRDNILWSVREDGSLTITIGPEDDVIASMDVDSRWSKAVIRYLDNGNEWEFKRTNALMEILFRNNLVFRGGMVLHASAIEYEGKAILFTAPAGTGKTTQSNLWKAHRGAIVLNGDRPAIRLIGGVPYAYGTPWSGSSRDYLNRRAPLAALALVEQAPENRAERLSALDALTGIMPRFFLPYHDRSMMELAMHTIEDIIGKVPIYLLKCRPDEGAVDALEAAMKL